MKALILILPFICIINGGFFSKGQAIPTLVAQPQMKMKESSTLNENQQNQSTSLVGTCSYMMTIKTSCNSPSYTKDQISTLFGDANGTEIYVPRLDDVDGGAFEQCSTNAFEISGPCSNKICKLYLFRKGSDGWIPEKVTAYDYLNPPITFYYNSLIPDDDSGYGFNFCQLH